MKIRRPFNFVDDIFMGTSHHILPLFFLLDDPKELYEESRKIWNFYAALTDEVKTHFYKSSHLSMTNKTKSMERFLSIISNGRKKKIRHWDLKVLAAYIMTYGHSFAFHVMEDDLNQAEYIDSHATNDRDVLSQFKMYCSKIRGKADMILSPFRVKLYNEYKKLYPEEAFAIIKMLHIKFYKIGISKVFEKCIIEGQISPFIVLLEFMSD